MLSLKIDVKGLRNFERRLSRTRFNVARRKALSEAADFARSELKASSRIKTGRYESSWTKRKITDSKYEVSNDSVDERGTHYSKYVTANTQPSVASPRGAAGGEMTRHVARRILPDIKRIVRKVFLEEIKR